MVRNIQEIKNPGGSNHFEQLVSQVSHSNKYGPVNLLLSNGFQFNRFEYKSIAQQICVIHGMSNENFLAKRQIKTQTPQTKIFVVQIANEEIL